MPQEKSREKDLRRSLFRRRLNRLRKTAMKRAIKEALAAAREGASDLPEKIATAQRAIDRAAAKGPLHKRTAARKKARLMRRIWQLSSVSTGEQ
ncbi:MAG: 30S ribosomal protein S20 [Armatimonadetes bacterium]|nr:30S ribosomal protein S20 [Armatimonadota bacterium]